MYNTKTRILWAKWTPIINMLILKCGRCDAIFEFRCDRWTIRCPSCGKQDSINKLRKEWVKGNG